MKQQKMKLQIKTYSFLLLFIVLNNTVFSQNYKGEITTIEKDGLHKILLTPETRSATKENFNSIRIKQGKDKEVSYVLMQGSDKTFSTFNETKITSKKVIKDSITSIVIENIKRNKQESITLQITNTKISKRYNVHGSDDGKNWFGLTSKQKLNYTNSTNRTSFEITIYFPLNTYKFIRIDFEDKNSLPINVLRVGKYESRHLKQEPVAIKNFAYNTNIIKEKKVSQLKFSANKAHHIDILSFKVSDPFFLRHARLIVKKTRKIKKRIEHYDKVLATFQLNSKNNNTFIFNNLNEKEFIIEIENQDNSPLTIEAIELFQKPLYLITSLKKMETYQIIIDSTLSKPSYDLGNFISDKTENIEEARITSFTKIKREKETIEAKSFWQTNAFMWGCIILGAILVLYFSLNLLKDIGKENN